MKRLLEITIFSCIYLGLMTPGVATEKTGSAHQWNSIAQINQDSARYLNLMRVDSFKLTVYPPSSGVQFYRDGVMFLSPSKNEGKLSANYVSFGINEAYYVTPVDSVSGMHILFSESYPFSYPCEGITFTIGYDTMYFTKLSKKDNKEKIFMAKFLNVDSKQSGWLQEPLPLNFCSGDFAYSHPSLSAYNDIMVFASDKEGTQGGWICS